MTNTDREFGQGCGQDVSQEFGCLPLRHPGSYQPNFFVPHSGVGQALGVFRQELQAVREDNAHFSLIYLWGRRGTGKTHLLSIIEEELWRETSVSYVVLDDCDKQWREGEDSEVGRFIDSYQRLKSSGGMIVLTARALPEEVTDNPHLRSRLLAGQVLQIGNPTSQEQCPIVESLLERQNIRLSPELLNYFLSLLPMNPLSCAEICQRVNMLALSKSEKLNKSTIRKAVSGLK